MKDFILDRVAVSIIALVVLALLALFGFGIWTVPSLGAPLCGAILFVWALIRTMDVIVRGFHKRSDNR